MAFLLIFSALSVLFTSAMTALAYASPEMRFDARIVALNLVWSMVLAGLVTATLRGAWAFMTGS